MGFVRMNGRQAGSQTWFWVQGWKNRTVSFREINEYSHSPFLSDPLTMFLYFVTGLSYQDY